MRKLSQTDVVELSEAFKLVKQLGFPGVRDWTHELPAYKAAWDNRGDRKSVAIDYRLLVEGRDGELVSDLAHASHYM